MDDAAGSCARDGLTREIKARLVVEGANLPKRSAALDVLRTRGVGVVPDFIANAGGVIAAAFAMDARYSPFRVDPATVSAAVASKIRDNTINVCERAANERVTTHEAARDLAQSRVEEAMRLKGRW